jgi:hypothetical protein
LKIEQAEEVERRKMREWEGEMEAAEVGSQNFTNFPMSCTESYLFTDELCNVGLVNNSSLGEGRNERGREEEIGGSGE